MVRFAHKRLDDTITPADGATKTLALPRDRYVRDVLLRCEIDIANAGTAAVSVSEADLIGLIKRLQVVLNGNDYIVNVDGYRKYLMEWYLWNTKPWQSLPSSIPGSGSATAKFEIPISFAKNPPNPFDLSAVIPAHLTSSFNLVIDFDDASNIDSKLSINGGTIYATVREAYMDDNEAAQLFGENHEKLAKLYELEVTKAVQATHSNFTFKMDLDVGMIIQKLGIFAIDSAGALSDTLISRYRIKQESPVDVILEDMDWVQSVAQDKRAYDMENYPSGLTIWDAEFSLGGLDTRGLKAGDVKFKANTTASSGSVVLYHREWI